MKLKIYIQDLIDRGEIEVANAKPGNNNGKLKMYQEPFLKNDKGKGLSSSTVNYDYTNHIASFDSLVGRIEPTDIHVNVITVQGANPLPSQSRPNPARIVIQGATPSTSYSPNDCNVTTHQGRVTMQGDPPPPKPPPMSSTHRYDLLDQLGKTPAQISILEILKTSSIHKEILEQALLESRIPNNINATQFQALIGNLAA